MLDCSNRDKKMATGGDLLGVRKENINFVQGVPRNMTVGE